MDEDVAAARPSSKIVRFEISANSDASGRCQLKLPTRPCFAWISLHVIRQRPHHAADGQVISFKSEQFVGEVSPVEMRCHMRKASA